MKRVLKILSIIYLITISGFSQNLPQLAKDLAPNYAVPDAPAFNMLNDSPDNILKPSSVKDMGIALADFLDNDNRITLPKALALEFSPALLINGKHLTMKEYRNNAWLYRLRVSLATKRRDSTNATDLAFGIRFSTEDESDLRTNPQYEKEATELTRKIQRLIDKRREELGPTATMEEIEDDRKLIEEKKLLVDEFIAKWEEENWNANVTEYAIAIKAGSEDSLAKNLELNRISVWYTKAKRLGTWGQYLIGVYGNSEKLPGTDKFQSSGSLIARLYAGNNQYKLFAEIQATLFDDQKPEWLFDSGLELKANENLWIDLTAGIEITGSQDAELVTGFKLKFGLQ